jgi:hypothetical protein
MKPDLKPEMEALIKSIGSRNMYSGNKIPASVLALFEVEEGKDNTGVLVPFWISVLQKGRGPRKSNKDTGLVKKIYAWMGRHNMFKSTDPKAKMNEARFLTWYINKYGNQHFRSKVFIDIYESARKSTIAKIDQKFSIEIGKITMNVI